MRETIKKILRESKSEWDWVNEIPGKKIYDPEKREKIFLDLKYALNQLPAHLQQADMKYFFDKDDAIQKFDRIVKEVRDLVIEYKSYSYSRY